MISFFCTKTLWLLAIFSFHNQKPCFSFHQKRLKLSYKPCHRSFKNTILNGVVSKKWGKVSENDRNRNENNENDSEGFENEPDWLDLFPPRQLQKAEILREYPDYATLEVDDPLFLDMPWPEEAGPEASAFGRHMQWRRALSDGESMN